MARLWDVAYSELVEFEEILLGRLREMLPTLSVAARREAESSNLPMIVQHLQTFKYRRALWHKRVQELDGAGRDGHNSWTGNEDAR